MTYENPKLVLTFLGDDLEEGHSTVQTIDDSWIVNRSIIPSMQRLNGLKSSSDQYSITLFRRCPSVEDIIATEGNIKAQLYDGDDIFFTGFVSTSYSWAVTDHGEQALVLTIESIGTRLFSQPFLETGYYFFDCPASAAVYNLINPLGLRIRQGDERKIVQPVRREAEAGKTVRDLIDSLFYECNAIYWFNADGELCIEKINADTTSALLVDSSHLFHLRGAAISLSKALRTYKGARVRYTDTGTADNYLVYRNTSGQDQRYPYCHLKLGAGEWYDGAEIYTDQEWTAATADQFREPTLISAVNAGSESSIVGSGNIIAISSAEQNVVCESGITVQIEAVGGKWFKITAHNTTNADKYITRMDLYASIVYEKNFGVIRTQIDGPTDGKSLFEEELSWIHDKDNAQRHANLLSQYYKSCGAVYTFYSDLSLTLGSVIELNDDVFSGLDVFVLVYAAKGLTDSELIEYKAVGVSTFNLDAPVWHGTTGSANPSGAQGPQGEPGATAEIQYALGSSITDPPGEEMQWSSDSMLWDGQVMYWNTGTWGDVVPEMERGMYIWMRSRIGDAPWQYTRLTGTSSWDPQFLGVYDSNTGVPTQTPEGLGLIEGDYFVAGDSWSSFTKGETYKYTGVSWIPAGTDNPTILLQALSAMKEKGVDFNNLNDPNTISWFATIISDTVIAKTIKAIQGFFDSIYVTGNSQFDGNIFNEAIRTYKGSNGATLSFTTTTVDDIVYLSRNSVMSELGSYGTYTVTSGSITIKNDSSSTTYTYTATPSSPFSIVFTSADFRIVKLSDSTTVVETIVYSPQYDGYRLTNPDLSLCGITSNSLVLADVAASAEVSFLVPKNSNSSLGSASLPFHKGWFGSFDTSIIGTGDSKTTGHCSLTNGLELKWGYIYGPDNAGVYSFSHTYTSDEGGPFATTTLFAHAEVPVGTVDCRVVTDVPGPSYGPEKKFQIRKYNLANTSTYTAGAFIRWFAIGY